MKFREFRHLPVVALVAVGLALAGCGGGGDGSLSTSEEQQQQQDHEMAVAALQATIAELRTALGLDPEGDDDPDVTVADLQATITDLRDQLKAKEDAERMAMEEEERRMAAAMAATAAKLYAGISAPMGDPATPAATDRAAAYNADDDAILVTIGNGTDTPTAITLSEDKKTSVDANHGWAGKRYADAPGGDSVEAYVYSNVEAPKMGKKFGGAAANDDFEYALTNGMITVDTSGAGVPARVALTGVTRTAGTETFELPDPNPSNAQFITVPGSFHGVSGTYSCDTGAGRGQACTASVAARGFTLAGTWTFRPSDPNARVTESEDDAYASYGWWLRKAANDGPFTASAFTDVKGTVTAASGLDALNGTATYMGGAAGKYALSSSTGGTNDAGHFTARATLEANFTNNTAATAISGTIDNFMGADGMARDWSVALKSSTISDVGVIGNDGTSATSPGGTVWTIGGNAAAGSGSWAGSLTNQPATGDGVPQVATGTFYSTYGTGGGEGRMVGAFGANKQ